jgi:hypothetical protein
MPEFDLQRSLELASARLQGGATVRRPRSDRGRSRLPAPVLAHLASVLGGVDPPRMRDVQRQTASFCATAGYRAPSRATLYNVLHTLPTRLYLVADLPADVQAALYNFSPESQVPGHQLAFYCLNYGGLRALSFAAGLPWLALYQAARLRGWHAKSRGLLEAIMKAREL